MKKRLLDLFLAMLLIAISLPFGASAADGGTVTPVVIDNAPIQACQPFDCATDVINGDDYFYTTSSGTPAVFSAYNIDDREVVARHELTGTNTCWKHIVDSNHNVYLMSDITLFRYDPFQDTMTNLGKVWRTESRSFVLTKDENDNIYIGTYPGGKVIKYDPVKDEYSDLGTVEPGSKYVRSLAYHNGYLYAGVKGDGLLGKFYKINASNPSEKIYYPFPDNTVVDPNYYQYDKLSWLWSMNVAGDYVIICTGETGIKVNMTLFDTKNDCFLTDINLTDGFTGLYSSPVLDNKSYFTTPKGTVKYFDLTTARVETTGWETGIRDLLSGCGWVTLENDPDYPNKTLVTIDKNAGELIFFNMETQKCMTWYDCNLPGGNIAIQSLENGPGGEVYIGGYMARSGARYNPATGEMKTYPMSQPEGMVEYNGKQYFGVYTGAQLRVFDPLLPVSGTNPKLLAQVGEQQDRPFAMAAGDNKIFMGTFPDYSLLGGALAIYDLETNQMNTIRNIVQDQSVMSIAYKDGFIYGTTAIYGGLGSIPVDQPAKIFIYDVEDVNDSAEFVYNFLSMSVTNSSGKEIKEVAGPSLFYRSAGPGDFISFSFTVPETAEYEISLRTMLSNLYGKYILKIDGQTIGDVYDGYAPQTGESDLTSFGLMNLTGGEHEITFECVGKNNASSDYVIGLRQLILLNINKVEEKEEKKVKEFVPNIKENFSPYWLGGIAFDKNGKLWVATANTIFSVDPETEVVSDVLSIGEYDYSLTQGTYRPRYIRFDDLGLMYVSIGPQAGMRIINPENMKYVDITPEGITPPYGLGLYTIGKDNNFYYAVGSKLMMISHDQLMAEYLDDLVVEPELNILSPEDGATYSLNQEVLADWVVGNDGTSIASETGTVPKGTPIDTSTVGTKSFTVEVVDNYGFRTSKTVSYQVVYPFAGVLQPAGNDEAHEAGSTIPVEFQLCDANKNPVTNAVARLYYAKLEDGLPGQENEAVSSGSANDGNVFRNSSDSNQYIFNLKTEGWSAGEYQLRIQLDDGKSHTLVIVMK